jgi:GMP synthase-like glutamine amidotransferase
MRLLVLQHLHTEHPGSFGDVIRERGLDVLTVELDDGETLPPLAEVDAILAMGGPMSANDDDEHPWLAGERVFLREAVEAGVPVLGACLGAQLLAAALGAGVYPVAAGPEVGLLPVDLTAAGEADPLFAGLGPSFVTCQWHGDTFDLPAGAELLASSPHCRNQAFRVGDGAYAIQFHVEPTREQIAEWREIPEYAAALEQVLGPPEAEAFFAETDARVPELTAVAHRLFAAWLDVAAGSAWSRRDDERPAAATAGAGG